MKKILSIIVLLLVYSSICSARSAITYIPNGGRLGDRIISYYRAKWLSLEYDIPLYSHSMGYGENLVVDTIEQHYSKKIEKQFKKVIRIKNKQDPVLDPDADVLYVIDWSVRASAKWNDKKFLSLMRKMIAPNYDVAYIQKPKGMLSIAIHVRTGGGYIFDTAKEKRRVPLKFPSFNFYTNQLQRVMSMYPDQKLYVHIFTDHQQPEKIAEHFEKKISSNNIMYGYRKEKNRHNRNVLDDFFNMMLFDVIIFPRSGLSIFAQKLGYQKLGITPAKSEFVTKDFWNITKVKILTRDENDIVKTKKVLCDEN